MSLTKASVDKFLNRAGYDLEKGRQTMDAVRARVRSFKKELTDCDLDYEDTDEIHLQTLAMAVEVQLRAFMDICQKGTIMFIDKDQKVKQKNHSVSTFYQMSKLINETSQKLGLSAKDRKDLNIESQIDDGFKDDQ